MHKRIDLVWSIDEVEYHQRLHQLEQEWIDCNAFIDYVKDTRLTLHMHRFIGVWFSRVLHLGNTMNNRYNYQYLTFVFLWVIVHMMLFSILGLSCSLEIKADVEEQYMWLVNMLGDYEYHYDVTIGKKYILFLEEFLFYEVWHT